MSKRYQPKKNSRVEMNTGDVYNRLTILREIRRTRNKYSGKLERNFKCQCTCGKIIHISGSWLRNSRKKSCGCLNLEMMKINGHKRGVHFHSVTNNKNNKTYKSWCAMKTRCTWKKHHAHERYKDLYIDPDWKNSFQAFLRDMGERPPKTSLDRIDNEKGYFKANCRWADAQTQANNRRTNKLAKYHDIIYTVSELAQKAGISRKVLGYRLRKNWPIDEAVETPVKCSFKKRGEK